MVCMVTRHIQRTLNNIEEAEEDIKEDTPNEICTNTRSAADMCVSLKDNKIARHILRIFNFVKSGVHHGCINNQVMAVSATEHILPKKDLLAKVLYMVTDISDN
jgi:hypothetical protein